MKRVAAVISFSATSLMNSGDCWYLNVDEAQRDARNEKVPLVAERAVQTAPIQTPPDVSYYALTKLLSSNAPGNRCF